MQVISFINMKGGVAKTTLAVNVAYALATIHDQKVLVVDCDPQFSASQYLLEDDVYLDHIRTKGTILDIFVPRRGAGVNTVTGTTKRANKAKLLLSDCICSIFKDPARGGKLDLIPSTLALMELETSKRGTENKLRNYLHDKAGGYDYVIIDCPPTISIFTQAAILASDHYLVPIKPDPLSVIGLPLLERWLEDFTDDAGFNIDRVGIVFTLVRGQTPARMQEVMDDLRSERGDEVFACVLSESTDVSGSVEAHKPVYQHKKYSKTAGEVKRIAQEFFDRTSGD